MTGTVIDIILGVILLIAIISGLVKGLSGQFTVILCALAATIFATVLTTMLSHPIMNIPVIASWQSIPTGWFTQEPLNTAVDLTMSAELGAQKIAELLGETPLSFMSFFSATIYSAMVSKSLATIAQFFGAFLLETFIDIVLWIVLYIAVYYLLRGFRALIRKIAEVPFFRVLDRLFGIIWSVAMTYLVIVVLLLTGTEIVIAKWFADFQPTFYQYVEQSVLLSNAHSTNVLGAMIAQFFDVVLPTLPFTV